jgi:hypothetical protein
LGGLIGCGVRTDGTVKCWNLEPPHGSLQ